MHTTPILGAVCMVTMALASPTLNPRAVTCGIHIVQHQRNENGVGGTYEFDAALKDKNGLVIGSLNLQPSPGTITSTLSAPVVITAGNADQDPIQISVPGATFASDAAQCSVGAYDGGSRSMDCGFAC